MPDNRGVADEVTRAHWERTYAEHAATELSWYQARATVSMELIAASRVGLAEPLVDVGAGASWLVDGLLKRGHSEVSLVDIAESSFAATKRRLGARSAEVQFIAADVATWRPVYRFALWHDRALFHFMTDRAKKDAYRATLRAALGAHGKAIVATFALDGPERCSGLPVCRYSAETLSAELQGVVKMIDSRREVHRTPAGKEQAFVYGLFERA
jgi:hypothetical protein